jgi:hypothetical protein
VTIGDNVNTIGGGAFAWSTALTSVTFLGDAPASVGESIFYYDTATTVYAYKGTSGWPVDGYWQERPLVMLDPPEGAAAMKDVPADAWFAEAVNYVVVRDLFNGKSQMIFGPDEAMTRAQLVTVLWRFAGSPNHENVRTCPFTDCKLNSWYTAAVNWAFENQIINGVGENLFAPENNISREQIVTILYRYAMKDKIREGESAELTDFVDGDTVSPWAEEAMKWAVAVGLIQGNSDSEINPRGYATRAQVATMIMRFHKLYEAETPAEPEVPTEPETPVVPGENELPLDPVN